MTTKNPNQATAAEPAEVHHNYEQNRFEISLDDAELAHADYRRDGDTLEFHHTYVPESARGRGHAATVVRAALNHARENDLKVEPSCSYVAGYIERNPEYQSLLK